MNVHSPTGPDPPLAALIVMLKAFVAVWLPVSVAMTVMLLVAAVVAVPEIIPVEPAKLSPAGIVPELRDQVYDPVPPDATSVVL